MQGSVSFQPAGESDWVQAVPNRPMTTGDSCGRIKVRERSGTQVYRDPFSRQHRFLVSQPGRSHHADPAHVGSLNINVQRLNRNNVFEVDTPNQAFRFPARTLPGKASGDGNDTVVSVREGEGESTAAVDLHPACRREARSAVRVAQRRRGENRRPR
jgi:hypothetical protein